MTIPKKHFYLMPLKGQSLLVTGAARGVGETIACSAAREGARVTAVDQDSLRLESLAHKAQSQSLEIQTVVADISTADGNARAVAAAESRFGTLHTFIANAAVIRFADPLATTEDDWDAIHRVNLRGVHLGLQAAIPSLRRSGGGSLILIASVLSMVGDPLLAAYGAAKGGLRAMCRSIAVAYAAEGIRCNTICPGDVETDMMRRQFELEQDPKAARERILAHYPLRRFASPHDVANAAIFLASDHANYITGTDLIVDGGLLAKCY
jgi:NAD(P)-dependent dehydrogenase (short-subunit alcohol dehydrogenase family)